MAEPEAEPLQLPDLLRALIEPGTGPLLLPYINASLGVLFIVLLCTHMLGVIPGIHLLVMGLLALGLLLTINW